VAFRGCDQGRAQVRLAGGSGSALDGAHGGQAFFAYSTNYLIDVEHAVIVDVEATTAIRQAEAGRQTHDRARWIASASIPPGSWATAPTVLPTCSGGWSMSTASSHM